jgi:hypothetical protein
MGLIMVLINGLFMLYVTRQDGTRRELRSGRVQRVGLVAIDVYDEKTIWSRTSRGIASGVGVSSIHSGTYRR